MSLSEHEGVFSSLNGFHLPGSAVVLGEAPVAAPSEPAPIKLPAFRADSGTKWGWAARALERNEEPFFLAAPPATNGHANGHAVNRLTNGHASLYELIHAAPRPGDVAVAEIIAVGNHSKVMIDTQEQLRLYPGNKLVGVFGHRYATDAYEGRVIDTHALHMLTSAGMIGTVVSRHRGTKRPTELKFLGYLADGAGRRVNLKDRLNRRLAPPEGPPNVLFVVGTGMNSGKTCTATQLVHALADRGVRVAACKITGSVCHRDLFEMRSTGALDSRDFSDYGFPSTAQCDRDELVALFHTMLADASRVNPEVVVMEIADGVLQRETQILLEDAEVRRRVCGTVLAAPCASSALFGIGQIAQWGNHVVAVSGIISNSPLFMREFEARSAVPLCPSTGDMRELAEVVMRQIAVGA